jgi:hypothetical protein
MSDNEEAKSYCSLCSKEMSGGLWTNGDGYSDGKHVGIVPPKMTGFCWDCVKNRSSEVPELTAQINAAFAERGFCGFLEAWVGRCRNPQPCEKHANQICESCGARATHNCSQTGQFVCGAPLCDECEHAIFPSGTNGGVGFNESPLPQGMKRHCKKSEQTHQPWYARQGVTNES